MPDDTTTSPEPAPAVDNAPAADAPAPLSMSDAISAFNDAGLSPTEGLSAPAAAKKSSTDSDLPAGPIDNGAPAAKLSAPAAKLPTTGPGTRAAQLAAIHDPADRERLNAMSNSAFTKFYDLTLKLQNGELITIAKAKEMVAAKDAEFAAQKETALSTRFFDHEEGYRLTPEYKEAEGAVQVYDDHRNFWQEQLGKVRGGQPYQILEKTDKGYRIGATQFDPKDPQAEGHIIGKITEAVTRGEHWAQKLAGIPKGHKESYGKFTGRITDLDKSLFEKATAPGFLKATEVALADWPAPLRGRPEIQLIAKMQVAGNLLLRRIQQLEADAGKQTNSARALSSSAPAPISTGAAAGDQASATAAAVAELHRMASGR